jgi:hypothetical protein
MTAATARRHLGVRGVEVLFHSLQQAALLRGRERRAIAAQSRTVVSLDDKVVNTVFV